MITNQWSRSFCSSRYFSRKNARKMSNSCQNVSCWWISKNQKSVQWKNYICSYFKFCSTHFWKNIKQNEHLKCVLFNEKCFFLNVGESLNSRTILNVGLNPEDKFQIYARLEEQSANLCFTLSLNELKKLLEYIDNKSVNILNKKPIENKPIDNHLIIYNGENGCAKIATFNDGQHFLLDHQSLKKLIYIKKFILDYIDSLEKDVTRYEKLFFALLHNFCLDKTFNEACESSWSNKKYIFFVSFLNLKCQCTSEKFTREIAEKCAPWFGLCVLWFQKTLMLIESERLATFSLKWPHFFTRASVEEMAKCGLYFTGIGDIVKCAFCDVMLDKWIFGESAIKKHFETSPDCPFLFDYTKTSNVSDIGDIFELNKLIALLVNESDDEINN